MARGQVIWCGLVVLAFGAAGALVVGTGRDRSGDGRTNLRSNSGTANLAETGPVEPTTATIEAPESTTTPPHAAPPHAASPTEVSPTTVTPSPSPTTTAAAAPGQPATLDPAEPVCSPPPAGGLIKGGVVGVSMPDGIHELSLDGRRDVLIPGSAGVGPSSPASWSADGRRLAFSRSSEGRQDRNRYAAQDLYAVDMERSCSRLLTRSGSDSFGSPSWTPDGSRLSYIRRTGTMASEPAALETARNDGSDVRRLASGARLMAGSWPGDGSDRLAFGQDGGLSIIDRSGKVTVVDNTTGGAEFQSWSPDSSRLVYTVSVNQGVWVAAADGSNVRNLAPAGTRQPPGIYWSRWAPNGQSIVYGHGQELWVVDIDGNNRRRVTDNVGFSGGWFTPDGDEVVYTGAGGVFVAPVDGSAPPRLLKADATVLTVFRRG